MTTPRICSLGCSTPYKLRKGYCPKHYKRWVKHGDPNITIPSDGRKGDWRSWKYVTITETCWLWTGPLTSRGYGTNGGRPAHRVIYERLIGPVDPALHLDHLCRVHNCVNPNHLEPVTPAENARRGVISRRQEALEAAAA